MQQYPTLAFPAAAPGHLQQQLGGLLRAAKVGAEKTGVHVQNHHQRQLREMMSLGQHLGTHHNHRVALLDGGQVSIQAAFAAGGIPVDTDHRDLYRLFQQFGEFFGATAGFMDGAGAAVRAARWYPLLIVAVVATQTPFAAVPGQEAVATAAFRLPAAILAENHGGVAAAVNKHQGLVALLYAVLYRLQGLG